MSADRYATRRQHARAFVNEGLGKKKTWADLSYAYDYQEDEMLYLVWYDENPKHSIEQKIVGAIEAFRARYGTPPNVALVSEADAAPAAVAGVATRIERRVSRNNIHVGWEA